ncbi:unnamed protein product [Boreogadus saida]
MNGGEIDCTPGAELPDCRRAPSAGAAGLPSKPFRRKSGSSGSVLWELNCRRSFLAAPVGVLRELKNFDGLLVADFDRPQTLKRDNSLHDTMDTVPSPIADNGLERNGHPPPLHSPIDDELQLHLSHSYNNNSSSTVSSLCGFPAEFKKLEYVGIKLASVSMIASPRHGHRLITPKRREPQPPPPLY